jgi:transcriptional antiterminator RfaH
MHLPAEESRLSTVAAPAAASIAEYQGVWWVLHTRPRNEKALANDLDNMSVDYFLPLVSVKRRYGRRSVHVQLPLFPSYLFFCGGDDERYVALSTHRVANIIRVLDQDRLRKELQQVYLATTSGEQVDLCPGLRRGRRCRVIAGSLEGLEGVVLRRRSVCRVYLGVEILGQSAEMEIDASLLELLD